MNGAQGKCARLRRSVLAAALSLAPAAYAGAQQEEALKVDTELVNVSVVVKDRQGRRIGGLRKEDFEVYEDGARQEIAHFAATERPLRVVLLVDVSVSMEAVLPQVKREATALVDRLRPEDEVCVISFATDLHERSGWLKAEGARAAVGNLRPEEHLQPLPPTLGTNGYRIGDANTYLYEALRYVFDQFRAREDRIAVFVFSDGVDTAAGRWVRNIRRRAEDVGKEVKRQAQESWALVYPIRYKTEQAIGEMPEPAWRPAGVIRIGKAPADPGRELFAEIARASGGEVFDWTTQQDLADATQGALADLRSQYSLGYYPPRGGKREGFHRLKVRVKVPGLIARARDGYLVPR